MARQTTHGPRVLGPYPDRNGFRIICVKNDNARESRVYETRDEALVAIEEITAELRKPEKTIREAIKEYLVYMQEEKGNKARSVDQTKRKLWRFFPDLEAGLVHLDPATCARSGFANDGRSRRLERAQPRQALRSR